MMGTTNLDSLSLEDTNGLSIAGTQITSTAAELNKTDGIDTVSGARFTQVQQAAIAFDDSATALMTIPDGAKIMSIEIDVTTGFDGTTPTYDLGFTANPDAILDGATLPSTAVRADTLSPPTATIAEWNGVTSGVLIGTFAGGGTNTAGAGVIKIAYYTA